jgi:methionyl-tRNA formyltransferase
MKVAIIGRNEILYDTVDQLRSTGHVISCILTAKEAPEYTTTAAGFEALAAAISVPYRRTARILDEIGMLREVGADIGVSMNYPGLIPEEVTSLFRHGILNAHGGDLPRYRGNACQAWAILNGEAKIGLCIHRMIGGELDSGSIITRDYLPIDHNTKVTAVWAWMTRRVPTLFCEAVTRLEEDPGYVLEEQSGDPNCALRCYPRRPADGRIDWTQRALDVLRLVNASNKPYAGAFCFFEGSTVIIWDAELVEDEEAFCAVPGQVTRIGEGFIEVACGEAKLRVHRVEVDGHVNTPDSWIRSIRKRLA